MAATTTRIFQLRPKPLPTPTPASVHFSSSSFSSSPPSSSSDPDSNSNPTPEPPPQPRSQSLYSSLFSDVKATLKQSQQQRYPQSQQPPRKSFSFGSSRPNTASDVEEIRRNLSEFRRRTVPPPPPPLSDAFASSPAPSDSTEPISLGKLYQRNVASRSEEPRPFTIPLQAIRNQLHNIKTTVSGNDKNVRLNELVSPSYTRESLKLGPPDQYKKPFPTVIGGGDSLPPLVFGPEIREEEEEDGDGSGREMSWEFVKIYDHNELGEKLRLLRPEKKGDKKDWFSLEELNQRLVKLREMEERDYKSRRLVGVVHLGLYRGLEKMKKEEVAKKKAMFTLDALRYPGRTPGYMLSPPKEDVVEKYFHPDNMSASEKLKLELKKVRDEFKMSESDCGSARVQVAQLTTKIKHLSEVLHKKDKHSRKGLQAMVERRKKLLKYMRRTDWDSYCFVLSNLGLRDNPGYKN